MRLSVTASTLVALFVTACGGAPAAEEALSEELASVEATAIPLCYRPGMTRSFHIVYYSDSTKRTEVGRTVCDCGTPSYRGATTSYYKVIWFDGCLGEQA
jgi:hypothetical protein